MTMKEYERNTAYDYLRVLASFGVIILHIAAKKFLSLKCIFERMAGAEFL